MARWLLDQPADGAGAIRCTHESLGQAVGLSRVTVSRVLGQMAAEGIIKLGYRAVTVLDRAALESLAQAEK